MLITDECKAAYNELHAIKCHRVLIRVNNKFAANPIQYIIAIGTDRLLGESIRALRALRAVAVKKYCCK